MIRMTKLSDYGFILLTYMAYIDLGGQYNARDLSQATYLPLPMVSKILKVLARGGILTSHRGVKGGYSLARAPDKIKVLEIISSLEGPIAITECIGEDYDSQCLLERLCPIRVNWQRINGAVRDALENITLEEMTKPLRQHRFGPAGRAPSPTADDRAASPAVAAPAEPLPA